MNKIFTFDVIVCPHWFMIDGPRVNRPDIILHPVVVNVGHE